MAGRAEQGGLLTEMEAVTGQQLAQWDGEVITGLKLSQLPPLHDRPQAASSLTAPEPPNTIMPRGQDDRGLGSGTR